VTDTISSPVDADERLPALEAALAKLDGELLTPALVIDVGAVEHNARAVIKRIGSAKRWRPHAKTLKQSRILGDLMKRGVGAFKVSTLDELALCLDTAERVHPEGEVDVLLAYPATRNMTRAAAELSRDYEGGTIRLLADSPSHLTALATWWKESNGRAKTPVMLDVDVGMHRTGSSPGKWREASIAAKLDRLLVTGLHGYEGHIARDDAEGARGAYDALVDLARMLPAETTKLIVTSGSHAFEHALAHKGLDGGPWAHQVSPGTVVLSDRRSAAIAEALGLQQAVFVVSTVVSAPTHDRITLDAGSKAIAPDCAPPACSIVRAPNLEPLEASEEHRPVRVHGGQAPAVGDRVWLVPDHACTTVNLHRNVLYIKDGKLLQRGAVEAMSRTASTRDRRP
jgi:D-serine deaminase-like pyridoxal phosphate-dependent protein